jgi:beta-mannosidase
MKSIPLDGAWKVLEQPLSRKGTRGLETVKRVRAGWIRAEVPGEIHLDLMRGGKLDDPLVGTNAPKSRWPEKKSWWYRTTFDVPADFLEQERQELVFEGIDLYGQVFLNGELIGEATNAFVSAVFNVRHKVKARRNELVVRVTVGTDLVPADEQPEPISRKVYGNRTAWFQYETGGLKAIRKPQFTYGWDWVDALPNIGIWRSVSLRGASGVVLDDVRLDTVREGRRVCVDAVALVENLHPWSERPCTVELTLTPPKRKGPIVRHTWTLGAQPGLSPLKARLAVPDPQLWWPNGMGDQPLYKVTVRVKTGRRKTDERTLRVGLRTVEVDRTAIEAGGSRFCIKVNGQDVFCKGGNWIPADAIIARVTTERYRHLVAEAVAANFTMLRVWGGGIYEDDAFYEACDEAGLLVWQDFMFACAQYPDHEPTFREKVRREAAAAVRRLRHHPCIALWCGNNENIWAFCAWWNWERLERGEDPHVGGSILYNRVLPEVCGTEDPARVYWPSSPAGGEIPNGETEGDCHWWQPATMHEDITRRYRDEVYDECRARFVSEYGVIGPCVMDSVREFLEPAEQRVGSKAWREHTNTFEKETTPAAIRYHYAEPEALSVDQYIYFGQMFQAVLYSRSLEALRFRKHDAVDDCQGALIWMYNDCWGEHGWTPIDYYLRRKPSYYRIKNAFAPVRAIVRRRGDELVTRIVNDTREAVKAELSLGWIRTDGTDAKCRQHSVRVPANRMREVARVPIAGDLDHAQWIYAACFEGDLSGMAPATWQALPFRQLARSRPSLRVRRRGKAITLVSDVYAHGVHMDDQGAGILSDNYFDLLPGRPQTVYAEKPGTIGTFRTCEDVRRDAAR